MAIRTLVLKRGASPLLLIFAVMGCSSPTGNRQADGQPVTFDEAKQDPLCRGNPSISQRKGGVVHNADFAKRIGYAYLMSIYAESGGPTLPMQAKLVGGVWYVEDTLPSVRVVGGNHYIRICQSNGRVLAYYATQ
jgi:hypothetical protein